MTTEACWVPEGNPQWAVSIPPEWNGEIKTAADLCFLETGRLQWILDELMKDPDEWTTAEDDVLAPLCQDTMWMDQGADPKDANSLMMLGVWPKLSSAIEEKMGELKFPLKSNATAETLPEERPIPKRDGVLALMKFLEPLTENW